MVEKINSHGQTGRRDTDGDDKPGTYGQSRGIFETVEKNHFFVPKCSSCKNEIQFLEGDTIYGDKWYHSACWHELRKMVEMLT